MKEFPIWNNAVTSHIAAHVKIKSIRCVECCLSFSSKEALMDHLHSCHSRLPEGICIDVTIENHERNCLQCKTNLPPGCEASVCDEVPNTVRQDSSKKAADVGSDIMSESRVDANKTRASGAHSVKTDSGRCSSVSDIDVVESSSSISVEDSVYPQMSNTNDNLKGSANLSVTKSSQRKLRKPSRVSAADDGCSEIVRADDYNWFEIVAATQPMLAHCPHCTFTCNTDLQLKV